MSLGLFVHGVDQVERVLAEASLVRVGLHPNRKELGSQVSRADFLEADVTPVLGIGVSNIEFLIEKALRRIRVGIHDDGRVVDLAGFRADCVRRAL